MPLIKYKNKTPQTGENVFIAPSAWLIGDVETGADCSIFFGATLRGDIEKITIGRGSNIQENAVFHTSEGLPCRIGDSVTVGHNAILHGCTVKDRCIIGMGATILDGAIVGSNCSIGANSLVPMNAVIPDGSLAYGSPARVIRQLRPDELAHLKEAADHYIEKGNDYRQIFCEDKG